jgi:predicted ATPase/DNA-binding NarL/FixJ family response regulator
MATPSRAASGRGSALRAPLTSLVGRTQELKAVGEALRRSRLVTVAGPGGVGKTRLSLEVARGTSARWPDGSWLVDLAAGAEPSSVAPAVARVLGVSAARGSPADALCRALADDRLLLVLDNCEHLVDAAAELASELLGSCPSVRILATSREPLGVAGETVWRLEPLAPVDAARLFVERAQQRRPEFVPAGEGEAIVAGLCDRLDRLPLAIELAAARVSLMSPAEILDRLEEGATALGGAPRQAPPRHETVRAAIDWSYELLDPEERQAFRALAVFVGSFQVDAALAVIAPASLDVFARLADKSLVSAEATPEGTTRYRLLETLREYAAELLFEAGELDAARERHLRYLAGVANSCLEEWLTTGAQRLVNQLDDDYDNVRAGLERSVAVDPCTGLAVLAGTRDLFFRLGQEDGARLAQQLLERCPARDRHRIVALIAAGQLATMRMELDPGRRALADAVGLSVELGEPVLEAWATFFHAMADFFAGSIEPARARFTRAREMHRTLGVRIGEARAVVGLTTVAVAAGDQVAARERAEEGLAICVAEGDSWGQGTSHTWLGLIAEECRTDPRRAEGHFRQAVELLRASRDSTLLPMALVGQACVLAQFDWTRAVRVAAAATAARERVGGRFPPHIRERVERVRSGGGAALGPRFDRVWSEGSAMGLEAAARLAFGDAPVAVDAPAGLSRRELEVATLVGDGLSNKEIAARLHLSVRTVESHVRNALAKIGGRNRIQLATWAREQVP